MRCTEYSVEIETRASSPIIQADPVRIPYGKRNTGWCLGRTSHGRAGQSAGERHSERRPNSFFP